MPSNRKSALGRGLDSLIPMEDIPARGSSSINEIEIDRIQPNPDQPRKKFDDDTLQELSESIRVHGLIQPISLRKTGDGNYGIIAGERRYRAAKIAGLKSVPAYIRETSEGELTEMALIENIQREDLNPIEIALTFRKLIDQYDLTQEKLSERIGKKRATIANFLRLLNLHGKIQIGLQNKMIDMGHARPLLSIEDPVQQLQVYNKIVKEGLSVRKVEEIVKNLKEKISKPSNEDKVENPFSDYKLLQRHLSSKFQTNVRLKLDASGKGRITFSFKDASDLSRLIDLFDFKLNNGEG